MPPSTSLCECVAAAAAWLGLVVGLGLGFGLGLGLGFGLACALCEALEREMTAPRRLSWLGLGLAFALG